MNINKSYIVIASILNIVLVVASTVGLSIVLKLVFDTGPGKGINGTAILVLLIGYIPVVLVALAASLFVSRVLFKNTLFSKYSEKIRIYNFLISIAASTLLYFGGIYLLELIGTK